MMKLHLSGVRSIVTIVDRVIVGGSPIFGSDGTVKLLGETIQLVCDVFRRVVRILMGVRAYMCVCTCVYVLVFVRVIECE